MVVFLTQFWRGEIVPEQSKQELIQKFQIEDDQAEEIYKFAYMNPQIDPKYEWFANLNQKKKYDMVSYLTFMNIKGKKKNGALCAQKKF